MKNKVISLYDYTAVTVTPWAQAGYQCFCYDIQHPEGGEVIAFEGGGTIHKLRLDLHAKDSAGHHAFVQELFAEHYGDQIEIMFAFPVCTDLAVSGAAHFKRKFEANPDFQTEAAGHAMACAWLGDLLEVPYFIENPVSVLSTLWRKPDYSFHPFEYGGYLEAREALHPLYPDYIAPWDAYSKKTCLWTGNGFVMPEKMPVPCESFGSSTQHRKLGGKSMKTKNIRSATPRGFARAVFEANAGDYWCEDETCRNGKPIRECNCC
jgi:hypothetical protein